MGNNNVTRSSHSVLNEVKGEITSITVKSFFHKEILLFQAGKIFVVQRFLNFYRFLIN